MKRLLVALVLAVIMTAFLHLTAFAVVVIGDKCIGLHAGSEAYYSPACWDKSGSPGYRGEPGYDSWGRKIQ